MVCYDFLCILMVCVGGYEVCDIGMWFDVVSVCGCVVVMVVEGMVGVILIGGLFVDMMMLCVG